VNQKAVPTPKRGAIQCHWRGLRVTLSERPFHQPSVSTSQRTQCRRLQPPLSQETLAEMIGATRSRVNFFMNKFKKLGFIEYNRNGLKVNHSLLTVIVHD
jgi:CRP-like cAMP-binding protein